MLSNGEGLLMGIINGFGSMANRYIEDDAAIEKQRKLEEIKAQIEEQKLRTQQALELEFAPRKAEVAAGIEEDARNKRVGIVNDALTKRADDAAKNLPDDPNLGYQDVIGGRGPLSEDQQAARDQGLEANRNKARQGILNSSMERLKAERDAGYKPDPTVVNAEGKEDALAIREAGVKAAEAKVQARIEQDRLERERREKQGKETDEIKRDNLKLIGERNENARIAGIQSLIDREEKNQLKLMQNFTAQYSKSLDATMDPEKHAAQVNAAFMASPQYKESEKRIEELSGRLNKALEDKPKAPEPTTSAPMASQAVPTGFKTPTTNDEIKSYPKGTRFFANGKMWVK